VMTSLMGGGSKAKPPGGWGRLVWTNVKRHHCTMMSDCNIKTQQQE
jgi:hypothetical protein